MIRNSLPRGKFESTAFKYSRTSLEAGYCVLFCTVALQRLCDSESTECTHFARYA